MLASCQVRQAVGRGLETATQMREAVKVKANVVTISCCITQGQVIISYNWRCTHWSSYRHQGPKIPRLWLHLSDKDITASWCQTVNPRRIFSQVITVQMLVLCQGSDVQTYRHPTAAVRTYIYKRPIYVLKSLIPMLSKCNHPRTPLTKTKHTSRGILIRIHWLLSNYMRYHTIIKPSTVNDGRTCEDCTSSRSRC